MPDTPVSSMMSSIQTDTLIIGGGLCGLFLAHELSRLKRNFCLVEARDRLGGRILSRSPSCLDHAGDAARYDLGPAWIWPQLQPSLNRLIDEINISVFPQHCVGAILYEDAVDLPPQRFSGTSVHGQSYRIAGGAVRIVDELARRIDPGAVLLNTRAARIVRGASLLEIDVCDSAGGQMTLHARRVVLALPPRLAARTIELVPALPEQILREWISIPTWMAGQAKVIALYAEPFWREQGLSGEVFSRRGPLSEIYDASPSSGGPYALFGFPGASANLRRQMGKDELIQVAVGQFRRLFGKRAADPIEILINDWSEDPFTATDDDRRIPAQHGSFALTPTGRVLWDGRLLLSGSETAELSGGLLEGALEAANAVFAEIGGEDMQG
ncbi:MAG: flavin monoamine oxidase family protein [Acidiferrobacterales bacterium]